MDDPHLMSKGRESRMPVISLDYFWMGEGDDERRKRKEENLQEQPQGMPIIAMYDRKTKSTIAHVVHEKGANEYAENINIDSHH